MVVCLLSAQAIALAVLAASAVASPSPAMAGSTQALLVRPSSVSVPPIVSGDHDAGSQLAAIRQAAAAHLSHVQHLQYLARLRARAVAQAAQQHAAEAAARTASVAPPAPTPAPAHSSQAPSQPPASAGGCADPSGVLTRSQVEALWTCAGGPAWAESQAANVAQCESGFNTHAYNPSGATGLWQILGQVTAFGSSLYDAATNALNAVAKFKASGDSWAQWVCQP